MRRSSFIYAEIMKMITEKVESLNDNNKIDSKSEDFFAKKVAVNTLLKLLCRTVESSEHAKAVVIELRGIRKKCPEKYANSFFPEKIFLELNSKKA